MKIVILGILGWIVSIFVVITVVDVFLMGVLRFKFGKKDYPSHSIISKPINRIDFQTAFECSGFSSAYVMRHFGMEANGIDIYNEISHKMKNGYVYPIGIRFILAKYGIQTSYCRGNIDVLKQEVSKGNPVIVLIRYKVGEAWLHYVPVVGYDEQYIYVAESLKEFVNKEGTGYNRAIDIEEFKKLWNTSMFKMPLYTNTFYRIEDINQ